MNTCASTHLQALTLVLKLRNKMKKLISAIVLALLSHHVYAECNGLELHAHRGSSSFPENSMSSVKNALEGDWDGAEIDIQMLNDGAWVLNHDWELGRTTSLANKTVNQIDSTIWREVYLKDRKGQLSDEHAAFFNQVMQTASEHHDKILNIEIKQPFNGCKPIHTLMQEMDQKWSGSKWFFTSIDSRNLECVRQIDKSVYLGLILLDPNTIIQTKFGRKFRPGYQAVSVNNQKLETVKQRLLAPVGVHVDIHALLDSPEVMSKAKEMEMPVYTYTLEESTDSEHIKLMKKLIKLTKIMPTGAIVNTHSKQFCDSIK